jgi:8-oxo-dGTP pyrophosphatase MutT (NUDIX family)
MKNSSNFSGGSIRGVIIKNNKILLVKEKTEGIWETPGGKIEKNEKDPIKICKREVLEETGFLVSPLNTLDFVIDYIPKTNIRRFHLIYKCIPYGKRRKISEKNIEGINWFSKNEVRKMIQNKTYDNHDKNVLKMFTEGKIL